MRVPGPFEQRDELRVGIAQAGRERTAELRAPRARVRTRGREVHAAVDTRLSDLALGAGLAVRTVLEADEPELGRSQRGRDREQEHRLPEPDRGRPVLDPSAVQRREQVDGADTGRHELGSVGPAARVGSVEREPVGGGTPVVVDAIGVGAGREQAGYEIVVAALHGDVKRCRARERGRVRIGARVEEVLHYCAVADDGCRPQR